MKDHLKLVHHSGCRALWLGVEDMTATLVNKGQSVNKTIESFQSLSAVGILPMPMMMHHDTQPLYSSRGYYGLLNQVKLLRKAGAGSLQVSRRASPACLCPAGRELTRRGGHVLLDP